jgi:hypothetical protein
MLLTPSEAAPSQSAVVLSAAAVAARAIPPAFPLSATVAVNPFLGQAGEDLATASARLARVAGVALTRRRAAYAAEVANGTITEGDLAAALSACSSPLKPPDVASLTARLGADSPPSKPLPTVADLAAARTAIDWPAVITRSFGLWAGTSIAARHCGRQRRATPPSPPGANGPPTT